jgi:hypothetical protein
MNDRNFEDRERSLGEIYLCFTILCIFGRRRLFLLCRLVIVIFLFVLLFLVRCFLLYTSCVLRGALRFLMRLVYYL